MNKIKVLIIPIVLFLIALVIITNLGNVKTSVKKPMPDLPDLIFEELSYFKKEAIGEKFNNQRYLVNFFASWCAPCLAEHPTFMKLREKGVIIIGINFRDDEDFSGMDSDFYVPTSKKLKKQLTIKEHNLAAAQSLPGNNFPYQQVTMDNSNKVINRTEANILK